MALYVIVEYINHICIVIADFYAFFRAFQSEKLCGMQVIRNDA